MSRPDPAPGRVPTVTAAYAALAMALTWPLATRLGTEIAADMGDPVFNAWVLMWTAGQAIAFLKGDWNALHDYWNGNIFHPERLTIAYSEHLTPQMLQILPIYAVTDNIVLCYNLLFLSTFVLSGLGTYLLVRDLTGRPLAAFVAGLAFAFAPYRISQFSHLQVLTSYWMPFALLGFRRFFVTGRLRPLAGGSAALALQNLSCGYYLLFFAPFAAAYCLYEMASRRLLRSWRTWRALAAAALAVAVVTWPFVSPYLEIRRSGDVGVRSQQETVMFSADTHSFATAPGMSRLWGERLRAFPKGEGEGFPGFTILLLAGLGTAWGLRRAWRAGSGVRTGAWQRAALAVLAVLAALMLAAIGALFIDGRFAVSVFGTMTEVRDARRFLVGLAVVAALAAVVAPRIRALLAGAPGSAFGFYAAAAIASALLALGPRMMVAGRPVGAGVYDWLWLYVPGFDGVRVPARFLMLAALFLAVLVGYGAAALLARWPRAGRGALAAASLALLAEFWVVPFPTNVRMAPARFELTPRHLAMGRDVSPLYRLVRDAPGRVVLIEFPFGEPAYEILSTFYAGFHRRPLVNGFSGFFPENYLRRATFLSHIPFDLDVATKALRSSGATHAIVHEGAFPNERGEELTRWLLSIGARPIASVGSDRLFDLQPIY